VRLSEKSELHNDTVDVEKRLREKRHDFVSKQHLSVKSDVSKHVSLVFEKRREDNESEGSCQNLVELEYRPNRPAGRVEKFGPACNSDRDIVMTVNRTRSV